MNTDTNLAFLKCTIYSAKSKIEENIRIEQNKSIWQCEQDKIKLEEEEARKIEKILPFNELSNKIEYAIKNNLLTFKILDNIPSIEYIFIGNNTQVEFRYTSIYKNIVKQLEKLGLKISLNVYKYRDKYDDIEYTISLLATFP